MVPSISQFFGFFKALNTSPFKYNNATDVKKGGPRKKETKREKEMGLSP